MNNMQKSKTHHQKNVTDHPHFHDTEKLLSSYRDVVWSLESSVQHVKSNFEIEYNTSIEDFLDTIYLAGADLSGTEIENHAKSIERSHKMLKITESAINLMRTKHKYGESFYWILYYTFLSPQELENVDEIIEKLYLHIQSISYRTYYRKRREAVEALSSMLWGYTSRECMEILNCFVPE